MCVKKVLPCLCAGLVLALAAGGCDDFSRRETPGELRWEASLPSTRSEALPDVDSFLLSIRDSKGTVLYEGSLGRSPEALSVDPGSYTLRLVSLSFEAPAFDRPQYGDETVVVVSAGQKVTARLECRMLNSGIRLRVKPEFLECCPDGVLYLSSAEGRLLWTYNEQRTAYFKPGPVNLILYSQGKDEKLLTRTLQPREVLSLGVSAASGSTTGIKVQLDTSKTWISDDFLLGGPYGGEDKESAVSVADAASYIGSSGVWLQGYVVGGDLSAAGATVKTSGITKATHLALASRASVTAKASCVAVELPSGKVREALNLVDHPELIGRKIYVKGNVVESYFGTVGLKGCSEWQD